MKLSERWQKLFKNAVAGSALGEFPYPEWGKEIAQLEAENEGLRNEISSDNYELLDCVINEAKLKDSIAQLEAELAGNALMDAEAESFISGQELVPIGTLEEIEKLKVVKSWQGVMHTPAYGEWNEEGYWQRGAHCLGPPQIEVMCREILEALKTDSV